MMLLDVNVLVYAHRRDAPRHAEYAEFVATALQSPIGLAVSDLALSGCLRVITHPKIFKEPTPLVEAVEFIRDFRSRESVRILTTGTRHWEIFLDLCQRGDARGNLVPDAYHAALAIETGCEWITTDRGFARFPGLQWRHPLE